MDCSTVADRIAGYLDGELARSERTLFEGHLEQCASCQGLLERISAVDLTPPPSVPETGRPEFWASMDAALAREQDATAAATAAEQALPAKPKGARGLLQRELRVGFPVVVGYALLLLMTVGWAVANLQRAQNAEYANTDMAQQLERELRQNHAAESPQPVVGTATVSMRNKF